jgi:L-aspartate oxidase
MDKMNNKSINFLIIGSGVAGLNLALELSKYGKILIVTKQKIIDSNSYCAQGGIAAVTEQQDSIDNHFQDTITAGAGHNYKVAVRFLVRQAQGVIARLQLFGVPFETKKSREGGHHFPRVLHTFDQTGKSIINALVKQVRANSQIEVWENVPVLDLMVCHNKCFGVSLLAQKKVEVILADYTILAAGGLGQIYAKTSNPKAAMGDGIAMAVRSGAKLKDMEFIQFHPTALDIETNPYFLLSETLRGEGAVLRNIEGEAFMLKYHALKDLAPRDIVTRAIYAEQKKGQVYLDLRHQSEAILKIRFPFIYQELKNHKLNLAQDLIPITPVAHYSCGGIKVDLKGRTSVDNLYALGEVACTGVHGANRLASNSLMEGLVFADPIVQDILKQKKKSGISASLRNKLIKVSFEKHKYYPENHFVQNIIREIMWEKVGIIRDPSELKKAGRLLQMMEEPADYETKNMRQCALAVIEAARRRKKSLGAHFVAGSSREEK